MRNSRPYKRIAGDLGVAGSVRALEVTYGCNGFHLHTHDLLFVRGPVDGYERDKLWDFGNRLFELWKEACARVGLGEPNRRGVELHPGNAAGKYIAKWGIEHEMTKSHLKRGRPDRLTPFDLLRECLRSKREPDRAHLFSHYARLFNEYADALKGCAQLDWSPGLRRLIGLRPERSDEKLAEDRDGEAVKLGVLPIQVWLRVRQYKLRLKLLEVARDQGWRGVRKFLQPYCRGMPVPWQELEQGRGPGASCVVF